MMKIPQLSAQQAGGANPFKKASESNAAAASQGAQMQQMQVAGNLNNPAAAQGLGQKLDCCA